MPDWDAAYRNAAEPLFGGEPSDFVREVVTRPDFRANSALCLADGDGRNGRWLAEQGLAVTAIDLSPVATEQALSKDKAAGVSVQRLTGDLADWKFSLKDSWDAVFLIFLQCESRVRNCIATEACRHLNPGGWFVGEGFSVDRAEDDLLGPKHSDLLYDTADLEKACSGLQILEAGTTLVELHEGVRHQGRAAIARFLAKR
ncbi:MAG: class I SAM-dependent methyltransferase [Hyphomicrobiaceae bacterium TMED74]|nr:hypothetical protein [Filomicrobium sp.]RPG46886.1 MAG: class I SAM-dependent methyltransferase [Hyphomicrobiaceae bacterium TMED74]